MQEIVRAEAEGPHVTRVILNRPDKLNAFSLEMFDRLPQVAAELAGQPDLRAAVLEGAGESFCAGLDIAVFPEFARRLEALKEEMLNPPGGAAANKFQAPVTCWQDLPVPVIAAVTGVCFGAGMQLALAADFRIAAPDARFSIMEAKWGLIPDMGITRSLPKLLRADQAKELIMTARIVGAEEALALGLITRIAEDPKAAALDLAAELAARSPDATRRAKQLVDQAWTMPEREALALEAELQAQIIGGANQMEAVMANMEKRPPKFR
ncbi:MAG: crotonase/enoyl-CoA hydratase family protein [Rhodobacteraceae bacterium]|nr:crotonase/enoyl-CoA hydratase family protein [Paracoccaceae bacterium]